MSTNTYDKTNPFYLFDVDKLCAVCNKQLQQDKFCCITEPILNKAKHISALQVLESISQYRRHKDGPQNICELCFHNTASAYKFQQLCNKSQDLIENFLEHKQFLAAAKKDIPEDSKELKLQSIDETKTNEQPENTLKSKKNTVKKVRCKVCHKLHRSDNLKVHMRIHTGEKPYECKTCKAAFSQWSSLKYHMSSHENKREYICKFCGKAFNILSYLKLHERTHTGERPYQCNQCKLAFITSDGLKRHYVVHTKVKPFTCEYCAKSFNRKSTLRVHLKIHTNDKPHLCTLCGKRFIQLHSLKSHLNSHAKRDFDKKDSETSTESLSLIKLETVDAIVELVEDEEEQCIIEEFIDDVEDTE